MAACIIFRLYRSLSLMSFTTCLLGAIVAPGDSIRALVGEIAENWLSKDRECFNCTLRVW